MRQSGIMDQWIKKYLGKRSARASKLSIKSSSADLRKLLGIFVTLIFMLLLAFIVFIIELTMGRKKVL